MTAQRFYRLAMARWRFVVPCVVAGAIALSISGILVDVGVPRYEATTVIHADVVPFMAAGVPSTGLPSTTSDELLAGTEMFLATSERVISRVAPRYAELTPAQIRAEITTSSSSSTPTLFSIHVTDTDPSRAAHLANDIAQTLGDLEQEDEQHRDAQILQPLRDEVTATQARIELVTAELAQVQTGRAGEGRAAILSTELTTLQAQLTTQRSQVQIGALQARQGAVLLTIVSRAAVSAVLVRSALGGGLLDAGIALLITLFGGLLIADYRFAGARLGLSGSLRGAADEVGGVEAQLTTRDLAPTQAINGRSAAK